MKTQQFCTVRLLDPLVPILDASSNSLGTEYCFTFFPLADAKLFFLLANKEAANLIIAEPIIAKN